MSIGTRDLSGSSISTSGEAPPVEFLQEAAVVLLLTLEEAESLAECTVPHHLK